MSEVIEARNEYRMAEFADILSQRQASGLSVREFCSETGLSQHAYYYRLRKLRQQVCPEPILQEFQLEAPSVLVQKIQIQYHGAVIEAADETAMLTPSNRSVQKEMQDGARGVLCDLAQRKRSACRSK